MASATADPRVLRTRDVALESARTLLLQGGISAVNHLADAVRNGTIQRIDIEEAASLIEGRLFYRTIVRNEAVPRRTITKLVDQFLANQQR